MAFGTIPLKISLKKQEKVVRPKENERLCPTLKQRGEKQHPFLDSNTSWMFDDLLAKKLIKLPKMKTP